jgi:RNA recognition motif-containing protein
MSTSKTILREKLEVVKNDKEGLKSLQKSIVVLELPFVVDEKEIKKYFSRCGGGVERAEL